MLVIPIVICYLYSLIISNNYLRICSLLKGVKTDNRFKLKKVSNLGKLGGLFRKEIKSLFKNKAYLTSSFSYNLVLTILLILVCNLFDFNLIKDIENIDIYINLYVPTLLALFGSIGCSTISSMSLEKDHMQILRTLPVGMGKILMSKWLVNVVIGIVFVLINGILVSVYFDIDKWGIMFSFLIPFIALLFVSLTVAAIVASLTIGGKALGKGFAINKSKEIVTVVSKTLSIFEFKRK
jgi:ABC-2 type transport system permease protein